MPPPCERGARLSEPPVSSHVRLCASAAAAALAVAPLDPAATAVPAITSVLVLRAGGRRRCRFLALRGSLLLVTAIRHDELALGGLDALLLAFAAATTALVDFATRRLAARRATIVHGHALAHLLAPRLL